MTTQTEAILYKPHSGQRPLHRSKARFRIATCGRRWGKTMASVNEIAKACLDAPGVRTAWIAPSYQQAKIAFRWLSNEFRAAFAGKPSLSELRCDWFNGSSTQFRTADNHDAIRGESFHLVVGDEFGLWQRAAWEESVRPTLADTNGRALLVGTPKGRNLFFELWARGQDREAWPAYESWQFPTEANPYIAREEIVEARQSLPQDVFRQEYEAAFLEDSAGVFRNIRACEQGEYEGAHRQFRYVLGWDPAKHQDASVIYVMDAERRHVVAHERILQREYRIQLAKVVELAKAYNAHVLMDSTGVGDPLLESLQQSDISVEGYVFTNASKQQLIEHLAIEIENARVSWPADPVLRNELEVFQYELTRAGSVRYNAPEGFHDDMVIGLALATWAAGHASHGNVVGHVQENRRRPERVNWGEAPI